MKIKYLLLLPALVLIISGCVQTKQVDYSKPMQDLANSVSQLDARLATLEKSIPSDWLFHRTMVDDVIDMSIRYPMTWTLVGDPLIATLSTSKREATVFEVADDEADADGKIVDSDASIFWRTTGTNYQQFDDSFFNWVNCFSDRQEFESGVIQLGDNEFYFCPGAGSAAPEPGELDFQYYLVTPIYGMVSFQVENRTNSISSVNLKEQVDKILSTVELL